MRVSFKHSNNGFKFFIGYKADNTVRLLCIILPHISGYIKYFENRVKSMFFFRLVTNFIKYNEICNKSKKTSNTKFYSMPVYDEKYIKAKARKFNDVINTNFWGDKI